MKHRSPEPPRRWLEGWQPSIAAAAGATALFATVFGLGTSIAPDVQAADTTPAATSRATYTPRSLPPLRVRTAAATITAEESTQMPIAAVGVVPQAPELVETQTWASPVSSQPISATPPTATSAPLTSANAVTTTAPATTPAPTTTSQPAATTTATATTAPTTPPSAEETPVPTDVTDVLPSEETTEP